MSNKNVVEFANFTEKFKKREFTKIIHKRYPRTKEWNDNATNA